MTVIYYDPRTKGRFTKLACATFVCTTFIRLCGLFYIVVGARMITENGVIHRATFPFLNQFTIAEMPLGYLSSGVVYALFSLFPLHTIFGFLGFFGVFHRKKIIIIIHVCFLLLGILVDILFITLLSMLLYAINSWIEDRFPGYLEDYRNSRLNDEVATAFKELVNATACDLGKTNTSCWNNYYQVMDANTVLFITLLSISIAMEIVNIVLADFIFRRLDRPRRSPGMFGQCRLFVTKSWRTGRKQFVFAVMQVFDMIPCTILLIGGIVSSRSHFVIDDLVHPVFENLRFNKYYLPNIVLGLAVTMIVIGCLNLLQCCLGLNMLCFKSRTKCYVYVIYQVVMAVVILILLIFWTSVWRGIEDEFSDQLTAEFLVYGDSGPTGLNYTQAWNAIFLTYSCCGVKDNNDFDGTPFAGQHPYQCRSGASLANSRIIINPYNRSMTNETTKCDTPLLDEIETYVILFEVTCGAMLIIKILNIVMMSKNALYMEVPEENDSSLWKIIKHHFRTKRTWLLGSIAFTGLGVICSLGMLLPGICLRFDDIFGHKDIQPLFEDIFISGWDVMYLVTTMSDIMISWGTLSFIIFGIGIVSVAAGVTAMYYVAIVLLIPSSLFKCVAIMVWIPMRLSLDSDLEDALNVSFHDNYKTDKPHTETYMEKRNLGFNTLFRLGTCCLNESSKFSSLNNSGQLILADFPWTCRDCNISIRWPMNTTVKTNCFSSSTYRKACTTVLDDRIHYYDTTAVVFGVFMVLFEILLVVALDRGYKTRVSPGQSRGLLSNTFVNNRIINNDKMPNFTVLTALYVYGNIILSVIQLASWIAVLIYVIYGDTQLEHLYIGPLDLGDITRGTSITILVVIPLSVILNVLSIRWCLRKSNIGLRWTLLPEGCLLIIDIVILCFCAQQLNKIRLSNRNIYPVVYRLTLAYLCVNITIQVSLIFIKDRIHKHIETSLNKTNSAGIFSTLWQGFFGHRYFKISGQRDTNLIGFVILSVFLMIWEISIWIVVMVQWMTPGYIKGEFFNQLKDTERGGTYTYGNLLKGLVITALVWDWIYVIIHIISIIAAIGQNKIFLYVASGMLVLVFMVDITITGLAGVLLDLAYNCNTRTINQSEFCNGAVSKLYNLSGAFIGFNVFHLVLMVILIWQFIFLVRKVVKSPSVVPVEVEEDIQRTASQRGSPTRMRRRSPGSQFSGDSNISFIQT